MANGVPLMFSAAGRQPDAAGSGHRAGVVDGLARLPRRTAADRLPGRRVSLPWALSLLILGAAVVFALARRATGAGSRSDRGGGAATQVAVP